MKQHWVDKTFLEKGERRGVRVLDFRSESGRFCVVEEEGNTHSRKPPLGDSETTGGGGGLAKGLLPKALQFTELHSNQAKAASSDLLPEAGCLSESLGWERRARVEGEAEIKGSESCFLINSLKSVSPKRKLQGGKGNMKVPGGRGPGLPCLRSHKEASVAGRKGSTMTRREVRQMARAIICRPLQGKRSNTSNAMTFWSAVEKPLEAFG